MLIRNVALGVMNGEHHVDAMLDTGSTFCIVPGHVARLLGFNKSNRLSSEWVDVVGGRRQMDRHRLEHLRVGSAKAHHVPFMVADMGPSHGHFMLLGLTFLRRFNVTVDFDRNEVLFRLRKPER